MGTWTTSSPATPPSRRSLTLSRRFAMLWDRSSPASRPPATCWSLASSLPSDNAGGISPVLRMVEDRPIISNSDCNAIYGIVGSGVVCIDTTGGKGTCNGDSGGPLNMKSEVTKAGQKWKQVGIVSFGASAGCEVGYPAGFSRVEYYLDWISSETGMEF